MGRVQHERRDKWRIRGEEDDLPDACGGAGLRRGQRQGHEEVSARVADDYRDPIAELRGPQSPAVAAIGAKVATLRLTAVFGSYHQAVEESLADFEVACRDLDRSEAEHLRRDPDTFAEFAASMAEVRAHTISYFHMGHALLDAIAACAMERSPRDPWKTWVGDLEKPDADPVPRALARVLEIRLRQARNIVAAHRHGWPVRAAIVGGGSASLIRRPSDSMPPLDHQLVADARRALQSVGLQQLPDLSVAMGMTAEQLANRAADCTQETQRLYGRLIDLYGIQTEPVSRITPSLIGLIELAFLGSAGRT